MEKNKKPKKETKLQELQRRIEALEMRSVQPTYIAPHYVLPPLNLQNPNLHYHGQQPCYNNPCIWC